MHGPRERRAIGALMRLVLRAHALDHRGVDAVVGEGGAHVALLEVFEAGKSHRHLETVLDEAHGPLSEERVARWAVQICDVLAYLHNRSPEPVVFSNRHLGDAASQALSLTNTAANDGFSESLNAAFTGTSGDGVQQGPGVGGIIHIGSQSKFVPYVVQVDRLGQAVAVAPADRAAPADLIAWYRRLGLNLIEGYAMTEDFAIVTRVFDPSTERTVISVAGIENYGTLAAGEFVTQADYIGAALAGISDTQVLLIVFGVGLLVVSVHMMLSRAEQRVFKDVPRGAGAAVAGGGIGVISAMMGIGGGTFGVPLLTLCGRPIHQAVATASGFGAAIALPAAPMMIATHFLSCMP